MTIYALHGFLGLGSDWDFLKKSFPNLEAPDLWPKNENLTLKAWALQKSKALEEQFQNSKEPRVLLGYSLGGRLAMHLLLAQPHFWSAAILVSANPGTANVVERAARKEIDFKWAQKFLKSDWKKIISEWGDQDIFKVKNSAQDAIVLKREEKDFDRKALAEALLNWSIAKQDDLAVKMMNLKIPVLWLAGEEDEKYCDLLCGFPQVAASHRFHKVKQASHRAPWDNPTEFTRLVTAFLEEH